MVDLLWGILGVIIVAAIFGIPQALMKWVKDLATSRQKHELEMIREKRRLAEAELARRQLEQKQTSEPTWPHQGDVPRDLR